MGLRPGVCRMGCGKKLNLLSIRGETTRSLEGLGTKRKGNPYAVGKSSADKKK